MANENVFGGRAKDYGFGRPGYAEGAIDLIFSRLIASGGVAADIGSGTGILSKEFVSRGIDVYCVEPNADMRAQADALLSGSRHYMPVPAAAEDTTLPDNSVDLVTAASSFHWFDADAFRAECCRILKPGGYVCVMINVRSMDDPFTVRQHEAALETCIGYYSLRHGYEESLPRLRRFFGQGMQTAIFDHPLTYTRDKFISRSLSSSYAPPSGPDGKNPYGEALKKLMDEFGFGESFVLPNVTAVHYGRLD